MLKHTKEAFIQILGGMFLAFTFAAALLLPTLIPLG